MDERQIIMTMTKCDYYIVHQQYFFKMKTNKIA